MVVPVLHSLTANNNRAFEQLSVIHTFLAIGCHQAHAMQGIKLTDPHVRMRIACPAACRDLIVSLRGYAEFYALNTRRPRRIRINIIPYLGEPPNSYTSTGTAETHTLLSSAAFALFAERAREWVQHNITTSIHSYPPVMNFARVMRNAVVHGGTVNISTPSAPVVQWRGNTLSHSDEGQKIIGAGRYSSGDLILLMLDLDEELRTLGAPIPLP